MENERITIEDLCNEFGVSRRTVRYYVQEGLLEPPAGRGRGGFYSDSHRTKLRQILALRDQGLPLALIRRELEPELNTPSITVLEPKGNEHRETVMEISAGLSLNVHDRHFSKDPELFRTLARKIAQWMKENRRDEE